MSSALVLGAHGTLGKALAQGLPAHGLPVAAALGRAECDIESESAVADALARFSPGVVFNAAAYTNVDRAEDETEACRRANALAPERIARACAARGLPLVHYSTDFVFDGEQERPYTEEDPPSPQGVYARTKLEGEHLVAAACPRAFVVRVGCLYGRDGRNFPSTILRRLRAGETIKADRTRKASPTWVMPVVRVSAALARTNHFGLYHATANGETTWADYASYLAGKLGLANANIQALPYDALALKAARPRRAILDKAKLRALGLDTLGTWQEQADAYLASETASG